MSRTLTFTALVLLALALFVSDAPAPRAVVVERESNVIKPDFGKNRDAA